MEQTLTPEVCIDLVAAMTEVHKTSHDKVTIEVLRIISNHVQDENRSLAHKVVHASYRGRHTEELKELVRTVPLEDPMTVLLARTANCGAATGLAGLATLLPHRELLSELLWTVTHCHQTCPGHEFVLEHVGPQTAPRDVLHAANALCFAVSDRLRGAVESRAYRAFLTEAARNGFASRDPHATRYAARAVAYPQVEMTEDVTETYLRLVLDGTEPSRALRMADALR